MPHGLSYNILRLRIEGLYVLIPMSLPWGLIYKKVSVQETMIRHAGVWRESKAIMKGAEQ